MGSSSASELQVVISTGGFAGMGRNYVQLPISQLSYNSSERHFVAAITSAQLQQASTSPTK